MNIYTFTFKVKKSDIDFNGHVNNLKYIEWMIKSAIKHSANEGFDEEYYIKTSTTWVAKSHCIEYKKPAFENDTLTLKTWIENIKHVMAVRKYQILKEDEIISEGKSEWVFVDFKIMRPKKIPKEISEKFISDK